MARQNVIPDPAKRLFDAYMDFSGGLNSTVANDKLRDNEFPVMQNVDLSGRGSLKRRYGRTFVAQQAGNQAQGIFQFYQQGQSEANIFTAVDGNLYILTYNAVTDWNAFSSMSWRELQDSTWNGLPSQGAFVQVPLTNGSAPFSFQTTRNVSGAQYKDALYIATGTKLCQVQPIITTKTWTVSTSYKIDDVVQLNGFYYKCVVAGTSGATSPTTTLGAGSTTTDGTVTWYIQNVSWIGRVVTPYTPTVQEAIYIGTNALADNPSTYIQDGVQDTGLTVTGIAPDTQKGAVQQVTQFTAYINKASSITSVDYLWEYQKTTDTGWTQGQAWTADTAGKTWKFTPDTAITYNIRVTVRDHNNTATTNGPYILSSYTVNPIPDKPNPPSTGIHTCNQLMIYWDRMLLWGDNTSPFQLYVSDLEAMTYFPVGNTINFDTGKQEGINAIVRFSDMLYIFTNTSVQGLSGKSPASYARYLINDSFGCVAERTARIVNNSIIYLSNEGVYQLTPNLFRPELGQLKRIDYPIRFQITQDANACAWVEDSQYWLAYPDSATIFRLYYDNGMWVQDTSVAGATNQLNIVQFYQYGAKVYNLTKDGKIYIHDRDNWSDAGSVYPMTAESKFLDMEASFNMKKLRRIYVIGKHFPGVNIGLQMSVKADSAFVLTPDKGSVMTDANGNITGWQVTTEPNFHFYSGTTLGTWVLGTIDPVSGGNPLGSPELSVHWTSIHGKCRRVKVSITHQDNTPCEVYGFGLEFKLKRPNAN